MFAKFFRENMIAACILAVLRIYLGCSWLISGWNKLSGSFDATGYLKNAVANPVKGPDGNLVYGWYVSFLENFALPNVDIFNTIIPLGEFFVGLGLILGCLTTTAIFFGLIMNYTFFLAGTVSHNPTDLLIGALILFSGYNAGVFGIDRWLVPFIQKTFIDGRSAVKKRSY